MKKKVVYGSYDPDTKWIGDFYCPNCNDHITPTIKSWINFCSNCGQELDWEVEYEED